MNYFDHAATTLIYPEVLANLQTRMSEDFANPSSSHTLGKNLAEKIFLSRKYFLEVLNAKSNDSFIFTSSATESNNTVISGLNFKKGDIVLYCKADHASVVAPIEALKEKGVEVISLKLVRGGAIDITHLEEILLSKKIALAVFTQVNHQSGNIHNVKKLAAMVKAASFEAHVHVDAVQAFGKIETSITSEIDSMSVTAHKIGGPKGIAGLYLKSGHQVNPLLLGGGQQEGFRSSTESYPLIAAFTEAAQISLQNMDENFKKLSLFKKTIYDQVRKNIPQALFNFENTSPYILCFVIGGISSDIILRHLEAKNTYISSTSACSSRIKAHNPTLEALLIPEKHHKSVLRISFGTSTDTQKNQDFIDVFLSTWSDLAFFVK